MTRRIAPGLLVCCFALAFGCAEDESAGPELSQVNDREEVPDGGVKLDLEAEVEPEPEAEEGAADMAPTAARTEDSALRRAGLQALREEGKRVALRRALSDAVLSEGRSELLRMRSLEELRDLNQELVFVGRRSCLPGERVRVRPNENLTLIARRVRGERGGNVTAAFIQAVNRLADSRVLVGQELLVPVGTLEIVVRKSDYRLYLLFEGEIVRDYAVGLGRDDGTPPGVFQIRGKTVNPEWRTPEGRVLPFGHPDHLIGNRWMGFDDENGRTGYGIHGTVDEDSIGKQESDGCIRLGKADVEELYGLLPEGARVEVRP